MSKLSLETPPLWAATAQTPTLYPSLATDLDVDVAVIGGGIMGLTAAYLLKRAGKRVSVLERGRCGAGETGRTTAHVTAVTDVRLTDLVDRVGSDRAQAVWQAGFAAMARIRANVRDERINCQFSWVPGFLHASPAVDLRVARERLKQEVDVAEWLGIDARYIDDMPGLGLPAVSFESQARLHPLSYLQVLAGRVQGDGSHVFEGTVVDTIQDDPLTVWVGSHRVRADYVIVATHAPMASVASGQATAQPPLRSRVTYAVRGVAPRGDLPEGLFWEDVDGAYDYLRLDRRDDDDEVMLGGLDHDHQPADDAEAQLAALAARLRERAPGVRLTHAWSGLVIETPDGLPCIGEIAERVFAATGFGGNGLTFATLAAMMASEAAQDRQTPWTGLFDFSRPWTPRGPADQALNAPTARRSLPKTSGLWRASRRRGRGESAHLSWAY